MVKKHGTSRPINICPWGTGKTRCNADMLGIWNDWRVKKSPSSGSQIILKGFEFAGLYIKKYHRIPKRVSSVCNFPL
jgi:hypothetical protein